MEKNAARSLSLSTRLKQLREQRLSEEVAHTKERQAYELQVGPPPPPPPARKPPTHPPTHLLSLY